MLTQISRLTQGYRPWEDLPEPHVKISPVTEKELYKFRNMVHEAGLTMSYIIDDSDAATYEQRYSIIFFPESTDDYILTKMILNNYIK